MSRTEKSAKVTTDHDEIRHWVEERGGWPSRVRRTGDEEDPGVVRIDFPGYEGAGSLERISWNEFFDKFEEKNLAFLYRDIRHEGGELDRFNKLVGRDSVERRSD